ncbi:hypothetical protein [Streptomyces sp. NPDC048737]|uniref:hypothetical protein n=1 Tax=unclassified Streptomyces TaxID=2593676 RepID=UPI00344410F1
MLQSAEYARHVFEGVPNVTPEEIGRAVAARVEGPSAPRSTARTPSTSSTSSRPA